MKNFIFRALCAIVFTSFAFVSCKKDQVLPAVEPIQKTITLSSLADRDNEFGVIDECYSILLPLTLILENGGTYIIESQADIDYLENDVNAPEVAEVQFPITLRENASGNLITLNSEEELENTFESCAAESFENDPDAEALFTTMLISVLQDSSTNKGYEMQFPVVLKSTVTGVETTFTTHQETLDFLIANAPAEEEDAWTLKFVYPLSIKNPTTLEVKTIANQSDLINFVFYLWG
jgi:hypothetical protein